MHELGRYRTLSKPHDIEVRCPACAEPFFIAEPDADVGVAACPRADCQVVCFVCTNGADEFKYHDAVALASLVRPPWRDPPPTWLLRLGWLFVGLGIWTWGSDRGVIACFSVPTLFLGVLLWIAMITEIVDSRARTRRLFTRRRHEIHRARWLETRERAD